ncbi:MAG TPA: ABC transporter permease [Rubricoccaceae bacterium]|nr:ABC transporter permease [Rubricoccaceae bacterium]
MLKHYLLVALRGLRRQKLYGAINVGGLALGLACCLLLLLFVRDELTFDRVHADGDRVFRMIRHDFNPDGTRTGEPSTPWVPIPMGPDLAAEVPEVEAYVRLKYADLLVRRGTHAAEQRVVFADPAVLDVFTFPLRAGDAATALARPDGVVLSETVARQLFGDGVAVGQVVEIRLAGAFVPFTVTGVARVAPNSTVWFDVLLPFEQVFSLYPRMRSVEQAYNATNLVTYVRVREGTSEAVLAEKLAAFLDRHFGSHYEAMAAEGYWKADGPPADLYAFQPLHAIHLDPDVHPGLTPPSDPLYARVLAAIALAVLLIACINFTTLAIGRSAARAKEVGVRKAVGARRGQVAAQFWGEAFLMSALALGLGVGLVALFLPTFNALTGKALSLGELGAGPLALGLGGLLLLAALLAGSYPALLLARLRPVESLKDRVRLGGAGRFARALVVVQFALSVFLLTGALAMSHQMRFLQERDLGFHRDHVVVVPLGDLDGEAVLARFRERLGGHPALLGLTATSASFGTGTSSYGFQHEGREVEIVVYRVEADFLETMGIELAAGRDFDPALPTDSTASVVVNQATVAAMGWDDPLGRTLDELEWSPDFTAPAVVGVVEDFNFRSLHTPVEPALFMLSPDEPVRYVLARVRPERTQEALAALEAAWEAAAPELPFQYRFLDEDLAAFYETEARWALIVRYATLFAFLVACLGLFGLAALAVAQRTKEVGIRKALGASAANIAALLTTGFARLVLVAVVVATPLAYLAVERWLETFAYRADLGPGVFLLAGGLALAVALVATSFHTLRAASADPVEALRNE